MTTAISTDAAQDAIVATDTEAGARIEAALSALSTNTARTYGHALRQWQLWADQNGVPAGLPSADSPELSPPASAIRRYLMERYRDGAKQSTLRMAVAALLKIQRVFGLEQTAADSMIADTFKLFTKEEKEKTARPVRQVAALDAEALAAIRATACQERRDKRGGVESPERALLRGQVDIALCSVLSDAGLRRSEAAVLRWEDIEEVGRYGRLTVHSSKTDAEPRTVHLTPASMQALAAIRDGAGDDELVFGLSVASISRRVKAAAAAAGLGDDFSGHSGRVGLVHRMAARQAPMVVITQQGRWKSPQMVARYARHIEADQAAPYL